MDSSDWSMTRYVSSCAFKHACLSFKRKFFLGLRLAPCSCEIAAYAFARPEQLKACKQTGQLTSGKLLSCSNSSFCPPFDGSLASSLNAKSSCRSHRSVVRATDTGHQWQSPFEAFFSFSELELDVMRSPRKMLQVTLLHVLLHLHADYMAWWYCSIRCQSPRGQWRIRVAALLY